MLIHERRHRIPQSQHHAILLEELEWESQFWITSEEGIAEKINDRLWDNPGASTAGGEISMPDEHLWRFAPNVGLEGADEEVLSRMVITLADCILQLYIARMEHDLDMLSKTWFEQRCHACWEG